MNGDQNANQVSAALCGGYIGGFIDANNILPSPMLCTGTTSFGTLVRVFVAYMDKNPKAFEDHKAIALFNALGESYACKAAK